LFSERVIICIEHRVTQVL